MSEWHCSARFILESVTVLRVLLRGSYVFCDTPRHTGVCVLLCVHAFLERERRFVQKNKLQQQVTCSASCTCFCLF